MNVYDIRSLDGYSDTKPKVIKIILESLIRNGRLEQANAVSLGAIVDIDFFPARVLMQDYTGVPALVDLASMREKEIVNSLIPVDLVIDHSVSVDYSGDAQALTKNMEKEFLENKERYEFLKWAQNSFDNIRIIPPGMGICHQINLEYLSPIIFFDEDTAYIDTVVGTDSHTTMINGIGVLGWGVGGIEAQAAMLKESITIQSPSVIGVRLDGARKEGVTATDIVLYITNALRSHGVVGKFIEFFGEGIRGLSLPDRATIANMAPEYGAFCGYFPFDEETFKYLELTGRKNVAQIKEYCYKQGLILSEHIECDDLITINLSLIKPCISGPKRPQDLVLLENVASSFGSSNHTAGRFKDGDIMIAAITSCTNTSNPSSMIAAGLLAKNAYTKGLTTKAHIKKSLSPGSRVVKQYLEESGLLFYLEQMGFFITGYGCSTCIGNSGELYLSEEEKTLNLVSVLSGNRNFEARIHSAIKSNYLASPALVIAYAILGNITDDIVGLIKEIWPTNNEINACESQCVKKDFFIEKYHNIAIGDELWQKIHFEKSTKFLWQDNSTYIKKSPFSELSSQDPYVENARILCVLGDSITTDHISPAGSIKPDSEAGRYLKTDLHTYGARRGNHEVMVRGTFANVRIRNLMLSRPGGYTILWPDNTECSIYEASQIYQKRGEDIVIFAGAEYGTGSSRDWAAKGTRLLGVKAVIAESFERIHRANLIGMGVTPFKISKRPSLIGNELITITQDNKCIVKGMHGVVAEYPIEPQVFTKKEHDYLAVGGILPYIMDILYKTH